MITETAERTFKNLIPDTYIKIVLRKSTSLFTTTRYFQKIDDFLAYIGGLFGFGIAIFFIMPYFAEFSY
jgi:hypothetical protein